MAESCELYPFDQTLVETTTCYQDFIQKIPVDPILHTHIGITFLVLPHFTEQNRVYKDFKNCLSALHVAKPFSLVPPSGLDLKCRAKLDISHLQKR